MAIIYITDLHTCRDAYCFCILFLVGAVFIATVEIAVVCAAVTSLYLYFLLVLFLLGGVFIAIVVCAAVTSLYLHFLLVLFLLGAVFIASVGITVVCAFTSLYLCFLLVLFFLTTGLIKVPVGMKFIYNKLHAIYNLILFLILLV